MANTFAFQNIAPILKKAPKSKGLTYKDLARKLHMSEANLKKVMAASDCSLERLNQICEALDLEVIESLNREGPKVVEDDPRECQRKDLRTG